MNDDVRINGQNYLRTETEIILSGGGLLDSIDLMNPSAKNGYMVSIEYTRTFAKGFGYTADSINPTRISIANAETSGSLTLTDGGIDALMAVAKSAGVDSYLYLGLVPSIPLNITVRYKTFDNKIRTDILKNVMLNTYNKGVDNGDGLYDRSIDLQIGGVAHNVAE